MGDHIDFLTSLKNFLKLRKDPQSPIWAAANHFF